MNICYHCGVGYDNYRRCDCTSGFKRHTVIESDYDYDDIPIPYVPRKKLYGLGPLASFEQRHDSAVQRQRKRVAAVKHILTNGVIKA